MSLVRVTAARFVQVYFSPLRSLSLACTYDVLHASGTTSTKARHGTTSNLTISMVRRGGNSECKATSWARRPHPLPIAAFQATSAAQARRPSASVCSPFRPHCRTARVRAHPRVGLRRCASHGRRGSRRCRVQAPQCGWQSGKDRPHRKNDLWNARTAGLGVSMSSWIAAEGIRTRKLHGLSLRAKATRATTIVVV
jgi:hypothetical protein